jgi:hypothetical protein
VDDLLLRRGHCSEGVEEVAGPHDLRYHDHLVDQPISVGDQLLRVGTDRWLELFWSFDRKIGVLVKLL